MTSRPARAMLAVLIVWLPYIASTVLQERLGQGGALGPALMLVALLMCWPAARLLGGRDPFALRFDTRVAALFALALLLGIIIQIVHWIAGEQLGLLTLDAAAAPRLVPTVFALALLTTFVPSIAEDILTRGFPLFALRPRHLGVPALLALSAFLYTANHLWRFDWGWTEQARLFAMGLAFAAAALRARSLWPAVGLHWGGNLAGALSPMGGIDVLDTAVDRLLSAGLYLIVALLLVPWRDMRRTGSRA